ncbi:MAG: DNA-3-methyladenine glycosylase 2 family protein [Acidimicrobiia bacterium]|nr:DNA-3-methyladenine glycosylase 2 family protein [Acidimicrobiia bacterium]
MERRWPIAGSLDLVHTLGMALPRTRSLLRVDATAAGFSLWASTGPATIELELNDAAVSARALGPGAEEALEAVPATLGLDDDVDSFPAGSGLMRDLYRSNPGFRLGATGRVFDTILPTVLGQRVTTDEAGRNYEQLVRTVGEPAPGDSGLRLPPLPEAVLQLSSTDFHMLGIEEARARVVREVAGRANRLEEIMTMSREDAERRLLAVRGVGAWTAAQVMGAAWGDRDAIPVGDFHLPNTVSWALAREPRGTDERMLELLEAYRPQRRRALLLVKMSGIHAPRYGPRTSQSIISRGGRY